DLVGGVVHPGVVDQLPGPPRHPAFQKGDALAKRGLGRVLRISLVQIDVVHRGRLHSDKGVVGHILGMVPWFCHDRDCASAMMTVSSAASAATSPTSPRSFFSASVTVFLRSGVFVSRA